MNDNYDQAEDPNLAPSVTSPPGLTEMADQPRRVILRGEHIQTPKRRKLLPIVLFLLTCLSTFWAGALGWPLEPRFNVTYLFQSVINNPGRGLIYMACVLAILFAHEMGHFIATIIHRVPASWPFFIPFPLNPMGTMGAVIAMDGRRGNRRQVFDIGIAGPLAGLVFAIPILMYGVGQLDVSRDFYGPAVDSPILVDMLIGFKNDTSHYNGSIALSQLNPYFMAGWVGLLITGLNMMPVSQLDGGHVIYTLFGRRRALFIARTFVFAAIALIVCYDAFIWMIMLLLVILIGTDHPPTRDDHIPLGPVRTTIGLMSLVIPVLCFPPYLFVG